MGGIYINTTTNLTYRWSGSDLCEIVLKYSLGETLSTAYAGDKGKTTTDKVNVILGILATLISVTKAQVGLGECPNVAYQQAKLQLTQVLVQIQH